MGLLVVLLGLGAAVLIFMGSGPRAPSSGDDGGRRERSSRATPGAVGGSETRDDAVGRRRSPVVDCEAKRRLAEALRARIRRAREAREGSTARGTERSAPSPSHAGRGAQDEAAGETTLDRHYIQDAIHEIVPLLAECYDLAREQDPSLEGRLIVEFDIEGEPEEGGVVEGTAIDSASTLRHPVLDECVSQTLYTLELPPPDGPGHVHVRYPFVFTNDDQEPPE